MYILSARAKAPCLRAPVNSNVRPRKLHMLYLQATKKALHRLGLGREELAAPGQTDSALGNWFVNVVPLGDREAFLFMSTRSLLSFPILIGQRIPEPADMSAFLEHGLTTLTKAMKTPRNQVSLLLQELKTVALCSSKDKSFIGVYSAIAGEYFQRVELAGGLANADLGAVILSANTAPRATLEWRTSFEVSAELLAASVA